MAAKLLAPPSELRKALVKAVERSGLSQRQIAKIMSEKMGLQMTQQSIADILYSDRQCYAVTLEQVAFAIGYRVELKRDPDIHVPKAESLPVKIPYAGKI